MRINRLHDWSVRWWHQLEPAERAIVKLSAMVFMLLLTVGALGVALQAEANANTAKTRALANCEQDFYVAQSPAILPTAKSTGTGTLGYHLIVSDRLAYYTAHCDLGPLAPTDPVVRAWMVANRGDNLVEKFLQIRPDGN